MDINTNSDINKELVLSILIYVFFLIERKNALNILITNMIYDVQNINQWLDKIISQNLLIHHSSAVSQVDTLPRSYLSSTFISLATVNLTAFCKLCARSCDTALTDDW